jgi:hypothetical protein
VALPRYMANKEEKKEEKEEQEGDTHRFMIHPLKRPQRRCNIKNHQPLDFIRIIKE